MSNKPTAFTIDELGFIQIAKTDVLSAVAKGDLQHFLDLLGAWRKLDVAALLHCASDRLRLLDLWPVAHITSEKS